MRNEYDVMVVGAGAMGTAAAHSLAKRGRHVLLLERFEVGHRRGSSGGPTRIFRLNYEDPDDVRMARLALRHWRELEQEAGETLLQTTGVLDVGEGGRVVAQALEAAGERFEYLPPEAIAERWPTLRFEPGSEVFVQEDGGVCYAERTLRAQARLADELGATVLEGAEVERIDATETRVEVSTEAETYRAPVAVITAGPWAKPLLQTAGIAIELTPSLEQVTYLALDEPSPLPAILDWTIHPTERPYTVPNPAEPGRFKVGIHRSGPSVDPDERSFEPDPERVLRATAYAGSRFAPHHDDGGSETCLYTNTPDGDFVLDRLGPLVIGSACDGHGFKFTPLIGRILADLALAEQPPLSIQRFGSRRPALQA